MVPVCASPVTPSRYPALGRCSWTAWRRTALDWRCLLLCCEQRVALGVGLAFCAAQPKSSLLSCPFVLPFSEQKKGICEGVAVFPTFFRQTRTPLPCCIYMLLLKVLLWTCLKSEKSPQRAGDQSITHPLRECKLFCDSSALFWGQ